MLRAVVLGVVVFGLTCPTAADPDGTTRVMRCVPMWFDDARGIKAIEIFRNAQLEARPERKHDLGLLVVTGINGESLSSLAHLYLSPPVDQVGLPYLQVIPQMMPSETRINFNLLARVGMHQDAIVKRGAEELRFVCDSPVSSGPDALRVVAAPVR